MKRILFAIVPLLLIAGASQAQFTQTLPLAAGDTVANTATVSKLVTTITDGYQGIVIHAIGTKISGTVAGSINVFGSGDGVTYDAIATAFTATDLATQQETFMIVGPLPQYIQVRWTGAGTMSAKLTVKYRLPKYAGNP